MAHEWQLFGLQCFRVHWQERVVTQLQAAVTPTDDVWSFAHANESPPSPAECLCVKMIPFLKWHIAALVSTLSVLFLFISVSYYLRLEVSKLRPHPAFPIRLLTTCNHVGETSYRKTRVSTFSDPWNSYFSLVSVAQIKNAGWRSLSCKSLSNLCFLVEHHMFSFHSVIFISKDSAHQC